MAWTQREPSFRITARATDQSGRREALLVSGMLSRRGVETAPVLEATTVEIVRMTTTYAPTNERGARKTGTSDKTTYETLHVLPLDEAVSLIGALARAVADASAHVPPGKGLDVDGFLQRDGHPDE